VAFQIRREDLKKCNACRFDAFEAKAGGADAITYPNGWQASDTARVALGDPIALLFLALNRLIPITYLEAVNAVKAAHGKEAHKVVTQFLRQAQPPPPPPGADEPMP
jgi:hypothetical protein